MMARGATLLLAGTHENSCCGLTFQVGLHGLANSQATRAGEARFPNFPNGALDFGIGGARICTSVAYEVRNFPLLATGACELHKVLHKTIVLIQIQTYLHS
jgi:hypothetical protein